MNVGRVAHDIHFELGFNIQCPWLEHPLMVQWIDWVDPLSYFSFQPVLHDLCNKGYGMCCLSD